MRLFEDTIHIKEIPPLRPGGKAPPGLRSGMTGIRGVRVRRFRLLVRFMFCVTPQVYIVVVHWRVGHDPEFNDDKRPVIATHGYILCEVQAPEMAIFIYYHRHRSKGKRC
jgi:hypothetical protein